MSDRAETALSIDAAMSDIHRYLLRMALAGKGPSQDMKSDLIYRADRIAELVRLL